MLNKVMLMGRLGRDPEIKYLQSGAAMTTFNLATDESWIDRNGQKNEHTEWHRIITFQRLAENCANHIVKGSLVYVEGSLQTRKWLDTNGQNRYVTEIKAQRVLFLDRKRPDQQEGAMGGEEDWRRPAGQDRAYGGNNYYNNYNNSRNAMDPMYGSESIQQDVPPAVIISKPAPQPAQAAAPQPAAVPQPVNYVQASENSFMGEDDDAPRGAKIEEATF